MPLPYQWRRSVDAELPLVLGQFPFATSVVNRAGVIVNTVGHHGSQIVTTHFKRLEEEQGLNYKNAKKVPFPGANEKTWIGVAYGLANEDGLFTEYDGSVSRVVQRWDRFDWPYLEWLKKNLGLVACDLV